MSYIPLKKCRHGHAYRIRSRNLWIGVFNKKTKGFVGIREKFGDEYLFEEYHADTGAPYGTVHPIRLIEKCPLKDIRDDLGSICQTCKAPVKFVEEDKKTHEGKWRHVKKTNCPEDKPYGASAMNLSNGPLFDYLEKVSKREIKRPCHSCGKIQKHGCGSFCYTCPGEICVDCFNKTHGYCRPCVAAGRNVMRQAVGYAKQHEKVKDHPKKLLEADKKGPEESKRVSNECAFQMRVFALCEEGLFKAVDGFEQAKKPSKDKLILAAIRFRKAAEANKGNINMLSSGVSVKEDPKIVEYFDSHDMLLRVAKDKKYAKS